MKLDPSNLVDQAREAAHLFRRARDEIGLRVHLAGMDARDAWHAMQAQLSRIEDGLRRAGERIGRAGDEAELQLHLAVLEARDRWAELESYVQRVIDDIERGAAGARTAIDRARLQAHLARLETDEELRPRLEEARRRLAQIGGAAAEESAAILDRLIRGIRTLRERAEATGAGAPTPGVSGWTPALPRIGDPAPAFTAPSTHGDISLSDYRGKWLVFFSHPADFTPVCTTEFIGFVRAADVFAALNTELLGLSIDSVYSHIAWLRDIERHFGVRVPFPVIADLEMNVAARYGMLHPGASSTAAVRAVFVIDPAQVVRALLYYPLTTGRTVGELLRLVQALQVTDRHGLATPEGWQPGQKCIVPPPGTVADAEARLQSDYEVTDWYFARAECPAASAAARKG